MDGHEYEYFCANALKKKGYSKVDVTKGSGDQGIDVIAYSAGKKYGIQCKYYSSPVGNFAVQEAFAGAKFYDCDVAVVLTNNTFTPAAIELSKKTGVLLWEMDKIPRANNSFWITKLIGVLTCCSGALGMALTCEVKFNIVSIIFFLFCILGGCFAIFERRRWELSFISCIFYFIATFVYFALCIIALDFSGYELLIIFTIITLISFFRADYLHNKTNGYHIWKDRFQKFISNNFRQN